MALKDFLGMPLDEAVVMNVIKFFGKHFMFWQAGALFSHQKQHLKERVGLEMSSSPENILRKHNSLVLSCSHPITHGAWPYLPNVVEVRFLSLSDCHNSDKNHSLIVRDM